MRNIVLIAHDAMKKDIIEWARFNREALISKELFATRSTGRRSSPAWDSRSTCCGTAPKGATPRWEP
jgi:methylglyoxal synthase